MCNLKNVQLESTKPMCIMKNVHEFTSLGLKVAVTWLTAWLSLHDL